MAVTINSSFTDLGDAVDEPTVGAPIRGSHWRTLVGNMHYVRSRLCTLGSFALELATTTTTPDWDTLAVWHAYLSANSSERVIVEAFGQDVDVRLTAEKGASSATATASIGGTEGSASDVISSTPIFGSSGTLITFTLEARTSSTTGIVKAVRVYEDDHSVSTLT